MDDNGITLELLTGQSNSSSSATEDTAAASIEAEIAGNNGVTNYDSSETTQSADKTDYTNSNELAVVQQQTMANTKAPKKKKAVGDVELIFPDPISKASHVIENLTADKAKTMAATLVDDGEFSTFQLGGVLSVVNDKKHFLEYGYTSFKEWVEQDFGMKYRKAMYLCSIYEGVVELGLPWDQIKGIGWTKLKTLLNPNLNLVSKDNLGEWVVKAEGMTVLQLEDHMKAKAAPDTGAAIEQDAGKTTTTMTFKLHEDQKDTIRMAIEKAKEKSGTGVDTVALELICTDFLGAPASVENAAPYVPGPALTDEQVNDLPTHFKTLGYAAVLEAFETAFPEIGLEIDVPA